MKILFIGAGGFLGAVSRYIVARVSMFIFGNSIPYGTFLVNVLGSFILGYFYIVSVERVFIPDHLKMAISIGFLGAFTTFSTFSVESLMLFEDGAYMWGIINLFANIFFSLTAAYIGIHIARG